MPALAVAVAVGSSQEQVVVVLERLGEDGEDGYTVVVEEVAAEAAVVQKGEVQHFVEECRMGGKLPSLAQKHLVLQDRRVHFCSVLVHPQPDL